MYMRTVYYFFIATVLASCAAFCFAAAVQTDGPVVGAVTQNSARVFVRTDVQAAVEVEYSTNSDLTNSKRSLRDFTRSKNDTTTIVQLKSLAADTAYYYRILVDGTPQQTAPYPSFKSFPLAGQAQTFSFAVLADVGNLATKPAPVYKTIAGHAPRFVLQLGDWDHRDPLTLAEKRTMHRDVRGTATSAGADFKTYLAPIAPLFHVWDDHDYGTDNSDYTLPGKQDSIQAYREYYPAPDLPNPSAGIWQSFTFGQVEFFMLDDRSERTPNSAPDDANKSMLNGRNIANGVSDPNNQKDWLKNGLRNSTATWKIITSGVCFNPGCKPADGWGGYTTEQKEIVKYIQDNNIKNVMILSGDLHSGGGIDNGSNAGIPELSVPNTNMAIPPEGGGMTTTHPGIWSEGILSGTDNPGYGWVTVQTNPASVTLQTVGEDGTVRKELVINAAQ
jgi:alkaline phosphatase D